MLWTNPLSNFISNALNKGLSFKEIRETLRKAGWSSSKVEKELSHFYETSKSIAVPRPTYNISFVLLCLLYFFVLFALSFSIINSLFDVVNLYVTSSTDTNSITSNNASFAWTASILIVFVPIIVFTHKYLHKHYEQFLSGDTFYTKLLQFFFLIGGVVLAMNLVWVLYDLLLGSLTWRFILKTLIIFIFSFGFYFYYKPAAHGGK